MSVSFDFRFLAAVSLRKIFTTLSSLLPYACAMSPFGRGTEGYSLFGGGGGYAGGYPMFPTIPWITVSQRYAGRPQYIPNPPLYFAGISNDQSIAYNNYRWDRFFQHADTATAAPSRDTATTAAATHDVDNQRHSSEVQAQNSGQPSSACHATNIKNSNGDSRGFCLAENVVARNCPSGLADDGVGCKISQKCCVNQTLPPALQNLLNQTAAGKTVDV